MHGLGADAQDMSGLAQQLSLEGLALRHLFLQAPTRPITINQGMSMPAWYDIVGVRLSDREDHAGIMASETMIHHAIESQIKQGLQAHNIILAGFSQGGAMALFTALRSTLPLGGIIALSAYLPAVSLCDPHIERKTPFFIGSGLYDPIVLPKWTEQSIEYLRSKNFTQIEAHQYPMEHAVCGQEIQDMSLWLTRHIRTAKE